MALRYDIGTLQPAKRRADGTVVAEAHLTRTGVFTYINKDGSARREYRPDSEVFKPESLETFKMVPVTDDHPPEMITAANARKYAVGSTGETIRKDDTHVLGTIAVHDANVIAKMDSGKLQVSCGYTCDVDETPGTTPTGEKYDAIQRNIQGNHLAIVYRGRADSARVRMDAAVTRYETDEIETETRPRVVNQRRDDSVMNLEQALAALADAQQKLGAEKSRADAAEKIATAEKARADKAEGERDGLKDKFDAADKARKDAIDATPALVRARVALETKAGPILGAEFKMDGADDRAIQLAVIKKVTNVDIAADKSMDYVAARFDAAIERASTSAEVFQAANAAIVQSRADGITGADLGEAAKAEHLKRAKSVFVQPK